MFCGQFCPFLGVRGVFVGVSFGTFYVCFLLGLFSDLEPDKAMKDTIIATRIRKPIGIKTPNIISTSRPKTNIYIEEIKATVNQQLKTIIALNSNQNHLPRCDDFSISRTEKPVSKILFEQLLHKISKSSSTLFLTFASKTE